MTLSQELDAAESELADTMTWAVRGTIIDASMLAVEMEDALRLVHRRHIRDCSTGWQPNTSAWAGAERG